MEVVHTCFAIVDIAAVEQGGEVEDGLGVGAGGGVVGTVGRARSIVVVSNQDIALAVGNTCYIALTVGYVVERVTIEGNGGRNTIHIPKVHNHAITNHPHQLGTVVDVLVGVGSIGAAGAHAVV